MLFSWYSGRLTWIPSMAKPSIYALDSGYSGLLKNSALAVTLSWNYPLFCMMFILYCPYWNIILPGYSHLGGKTISWLHIPFNLTYISPLQSPTIFTSKHILNLTTSNLLYYYFRSNSGQYHLMLALLQWLCN